MINSHGVKQMQNNYHHKYHDHNIFSTHKTPGERIIKKTSVLFLKNIQRGGKRNAEYHQCTRNIDGCCGTGS
jgi:hypothetical protein